jgi:hypothetical protein
LGNDLGGLRNRFEYSGSKADLDQAVELHNNMSLPGSVQEALNLDQQGWEALQAVLYIYDGSLLDSDPANPRH